MTLNAFFELFGKSDAVHAAALATVLAACIAGVFKLVEIVGEALNTWLAELRSRDRALWEYLEKSLQEYYSNSNLLWIIENLKREHSGKYVDDGSRILLAGRQLPAFLEPIGIYLYTRQGTTRRSYRPFAQAVLLCDQSQIMWPEGEREEAFWIAFNQFAAATKRQGYYLSETGDVKFNPFGKYSSQRRIKVNKALV